MKRFLILLVSILITVSCNKEEGSVYHYEVPAKTNDGWEVCSSDEAGLNSAQLIEMTDYIEATKDHKIHGIVIIKNGKLVFEKYFEGYLYSNNPPGSNGDFIQYNMETDHYLASVSKSVTSVIFGAAVKAGYIESVDDLLIDILPKYKNILIGDKAKITIKHLLTMSSGLHWDEWSSSYEDPTNDVVALFNEEDPIEYTLSKYMINSSGVEFLYNSGGTNVLGAVIEEKTGMSLLDFGNEYLFDPLNVQGGLWERMAGGYFFASGGIYLRPRELSKIGFLFLNDGYWNDLKIITKEWIRESTLEYIQPNMLIPQAHAYGYQWWIMDSQANNQSYECFFAAGWGDQYMFIFPDQDMIITINCGNFTSSGNISIFTLIENYILPGLT
ncbi:serine hydrolase domain-containing protein [Bacteroidota bacterium]